MLKSRTYFARPARVFRSTDPAEKKIQVQLARICVLYDDLMLEFAGAEQTSLPALDESGMRSRRFYFVRRTLATLSELRSAFLALNMNKTFEARKARWPKEAQQGWDGAILFFNTDPAFLRNWRNDVGGHFHDSAAEFAIDNIEDDTAGAIELYRRGNGAGVRMKMAYELVAVAMVKNRDAQKHTVEEFLKEAFTYLRDATDQSVTAVHTVTLTEILDRFR